MTEFAPFSSLYIHWPFCPYKCHFCPFVALASHDEYMGQYHEALMKEIQYFAAARKQPDVIHTLFLGGGTPSTWPVPLLLDTFDKLNNVFVFAPDAEISIEVNPGTVDYQKLATWQQIGINRLSIGVQSLNDEVLKKLNRHQTAEQVVKVLDDASKLFENISVDVILGLPGVARSEWKTLIQTLVQWPIKHLSLYFLTVHEDTPLYFGIKTKKITLPADDEMVELYYWSIETLAQHGFEQYEISNFARPGYRSRHNSAYWQRVPYKGFGLGACSFDGLRRMQNEKNLMKYLAIAGTGQSLEIYEETLTDEQAWLEKVMLGLRQKDGISRETLTNSLAPHEQDALYRKIQALTQAGLLVQSNDTIRLSVQGLAVENEIILQISQR